MKSRSTKMLVNLLVLMLALMPLRSVIAMPVMMPMDHCKMQSGAHEAMTQTMTHHAHHQMQTDAMKPAEPMSKKPGCACCANCDGQCTGCVHISAVVTDPASLFAEVGLVESISLIAYPLESRTVSPPSRPPLTL